MRMIVPFTMSIDDAQGTWKLGQNKPDAARLGAADRVASHGIGEALELLADLMRDPGET